MPYDRVNKIMFYCGFGVLSLFGQQVKTSLLGCRNGGGLPLGTLLHVDGFVYYYLCVEMMLLLPISS